jgi:alkanesulfonate monooxygenase
MNKENIKFINAFSARNERNDDYKLLLDSAIEQSVHVGFDYTLITVSNGRYDPWAISQYGLERNIKFNPLIAVNPAFQHPLSVIKRVSALQNLYLKKIAINLVSGSFFGDMSSIGDTLGFDERNQRLIEFLTICKELENKGTAFSFKGSFYNFENQDYFPHLNKNISIDYFLSGSFTDQLSNINEDLYFVKNMKPLDLTEKAKNFNCGLGSGI